MNIPQSSEPPTAPSRPHLGVAAIALGAVLAGAAVFHFAKRSDNPAAATVAPSPQPTPGSSVPPARDQIFRELPKEPTAPTVEPSSTNSTAETRPTVASLKALAALDHSRALALALTEPDPVSRDELLRAVLEGWASVAPEAAADWARSQSGLEFGQAFAAVFNGASQQPDAAIRLVQRLSETDPKNAGAYAGYLVFAFGQLQKFALAAKVAASGAEEFRTDLLTAAYRTWAEHQPKLALAATAELEDPGMRRTAFEATLGGWAKANPEELTEVALTLPEGPDRKLALLTALRQWIERDPAAAAEWASRTNFFPEMEATLEE